MTPEQKFSEVELGRFHYSSSPDRGLNNILYLWPFIREKCPDVKLHVYYGLHNWRSSAEQRKDHAALKQIEDVEKAVSEAGDSVIFHDRVNQVELAKEWRKAWIWFYPTWFSETYCLTANEAQASRTPILCSDVGALKTTVKDFGIRKFENAYSAEARAFYLDEIVKLYHDRDYWRKWSNYSYAGLIAEKFSWPDRWRQHWGPLFDTAFA